MIPIVGRLPLGLARLFGVPGQGPTILDGTVFPVTEVDSPAPELAYIKSERLFAGSCTMAGGAGTRSGCTLTVATGAGILAVITKIEAYVGAATNLELYIGNIPNAGTPSAVGPRDTRIGNIGPLGGAASVQLSNTYAGAPAVGRAGIFTLAAAGLWVIDQPIVISPPFTAAQTNGVLVLTSANNIGMSVTFWYRERPLASGESTL